jgi:hypothetical protein
MMKKLVFLAPIVLAAALAGCAVYAPGPPGGAVIIAPPLPAVVEFETEPVYTYQGYYYFYDNGAWYYSNARTGNRYFLPRDRWPRETRWKGRGEEHERGRGGGWERH